MPACLQEEGINFIDPEDFDQQVLQQHFAAARQQQGADVVLAFVHWGPNWGWQPSAALRRLGAALVDAGADVVFGHSAHHIQVGLPGLMSGGGGGPPAISLRQASCRLAAVAAGRSARRAAAER
jgi:hypothetical protein